MLLQFSEYAGLAQVMMVLFIAAFVGIAWWAFRPSNKSKMKKFGEIPFKEEMNNGR